MDTNKENEIASVIQSRASTARLVQGLIDFATSSVVRKTRVQINEQRRGTRSQRSVTDWPTKIAMPVPIVTMSTKSVDSRRNDVNFR